MFLSCFNKTISKFDENYETFCRFESVIKKVKLSRILFVLIMCVFSENFVHVENMVGLTF